MMRFILSRALSLDHVRKLAKKSKQKGITDPAQIILKAVPTRTLPGSGAPPLSENRKGASARELEQEGDEEERFTMIEAKRVRDDAVKKAPSVFIDT